MFKHKKITLSVTAGILLSAIALYVTFAHIPLTQVVDYLGTVNYWWIIPSTAIALLSFLIRVVRWQLLLYPVKETRFWSAYHPLVIGFMLNCVLPGRVGELARPAIFHKQEGVAFSKVLATVGVERAFDVLILILSFIVVFATVEVSSSLDLPFGNYHLNKATLEMTGVTMVRLFLVLLLCIVFLSIRYTRSLIKQGVLSLAGLFFWTSSPFKEKVRQKFLLRIAHMIDQVAEGFALLRSPKKAGLCFGLSLLVWGVAGFSYYVMAFGCPGIELSFFEMYAAMVILCFFIALPSVPGFWGLWEAGGVFALLIFGVSSKEAAGFTLANHVVQMVPVIIIGFISSVIIGMNAVRTAYGESIEDRLPEDGEETGIG